VRVDKFASSHPQQRGNAFHDKIERPQGKKLQLQRRCVIHELRQNGRQQKICFRVSQERQKLSPHQRENVRNVDLS